MTIGTVAVLLGLAAVAWVLTVQQALGMAGMVMGLAEVGARMPYAATAPVFLAMWLTMMVAMMFPTIAPVVLVHRLVVRHRGEGTLPSIAFVLGYLAVWTAIGVVPLAAFLAFRSLPDTATLREWLPRISGLVLLGAGLYQFTAWKGACLRACRTPLSFVMTHDFGSGAPGAFKAGLSHGAYCLGCCWALMAVLVVVGLMNLIWMAAIALVFLAEKNWSHGVALNRVAGAAVALLGCAVLVDPGLLVVLSRGAMPQSSMRGM